MSACFGVFGVLEAKEPHFVLNRSRCKQAWPPTLPHGDGDGDPATEPDEPQKLND